MSNQKQLLQQFFGSTNVFFPSIHPPGQMRWRIWGLTLHSASHLLELDGRPSLCWPAVRSTSFFLQRCIIEPYHGYVERFVDPSKPKSPEHLQSLLCAVCALVTLLFVASNVLTGAISLPTLVRQADRELNELMQSFRDSLPSNRRAAAARLEAQQEVAVIMPTPDTPVFDPALAQEYRGEPVDTVINAYRGE